MSVKPLIGITGVPRDVPTGYGGDVADTATHAMVRGVADAGGVPVVLPVVEPALAAAQTEPLDGLVLAGGQDLAGDEDGDRSGRWIHPPRDRHEFAVWAAATGAGMPVLGICRGLQLVNVALGGSLVAHVDGHDAQGDHVDACHPVSIASGSRLEAVVRSSGASVNTLHHQVIDALGRGLRATAWSPDGLVEAAELDDPWFVGVQWHPELMLGQAAGQGLFDLLVEAARRG